MKKNKTHKYYTLVGKLQPSWLAKVLNPLVLWLTGAHKANRIISMYDHLKNQEIIGAIAKKLGLLICVRDSPNIPLHNAVSIAGNHPGGADVFAYAHAILTQRADVKIIVNKELDLQPICDVIIPKVSTQQVVKKVINAYDDGKVLVYNPEGRSSRYQDGEVKDLYWHPLFLKMSIKHNTPLVLFHVTGRNHWWFYRLARWREKCGITKPLEMFMHMRNIFYPPVKRIFICFAPPINVDMQQYVIQESGSSKDAAEVYRTYVYNTRCELSFEDWYVDTIMISELVKLETNQKNINLGKII